MMTVIGKKFLTRVRNYVISALRTPETACNYLLFNNARSILVSVRFMAVADAAATGRLGSWIGSHEPFWMLYKGDKLF